MTVVCSSDSGCMKTIEMFLPLMLFVKLVIISGCCVFLVESLLWMFNKEDDDELDIWWELRFPLKVQLNPLEKRDYQVFFTYNVLFWFLVLLLHLTIDMELSKGSHFQDESWWFGF
jgi:hypothetical protein